ncbi:MAG: hypothetical protein ACRC7N_14930 [Clostridium sp.]
MGQYISFTLTHNIKVSKENLQRYNISKEEILKSLDKEFDTTLYDLIEFEEYFELRAKEELFNKNTLKGFLKEQFELFNCTEDELFDKLDSLDSYEDIVNFAEDKPFCNFQEQTGVYGVRCGGWNSFRVHTMGIIFFLEGKAYLECYDEMFNYIRRLIVKSSDYEIARLVKIVLE